jgi:hypothetical protein
MMLIAVFLCAGMMTVTSVAAATDAETKESVTVSKTVKKKAVKKAKKNKGKLIQKNGYTYYKLNGKIVKKRFIKIKDNTYHFGKDGTMTMGWLCSKGDYYCFSRINGKMFKNRKVDGIKLDKNGRAEKTDLNVEKIKTMIRARLQMRKICKASDSKEVKLRKCFDWVATIPYKRYRFLNKMYNEKGWESTFANDIFQKGDGCCVSEASALAFLVHECGYKTVYVAHDTEHAWMELGGKVYDTLFARAKDYEKYYNLSYDKYECYAVDKRKI